MLASPAPFPTISAFPSSGSGPVSRKPILSISPDCVGGLGLSPDGNGEKSEEIQSNSINVGYDYHNYKWSLNETCTTGVRYQEVINFGRCVSPRVNHHCVMCGSSNTAIPSQNKDVCKTCDTSFWLYTKLNVIVKFCKGCKNFVVLSDFDDKPEASKCGRCRRRGRQNYFTKKKGGNYGEGDYPDYSVSTPELGFGRQSSSISSNTRGSSGTTLTTRSQSAINSSSCDSLVLSFPSTSGTSTQISNGRPPVPRKSAQNLQTTSATSKAAISPASLIAKSFTMPGGAYNDTPSNTSHTSKNSGTRNGTAAGASTTIQSNSGPHSAKLSNQNIIETSGSVSSIGSFTRNVRFDGMTSPFHFDSPSSISSEEELKPALGAVMSNIQVPHVKNEWDPSANPLLHLAMLTEKMFGSGASPAKFPTPVSSEHVSSTSKHSVVLLNGSQLHLPIAPRASPSSPPSPSPLSFTPSPVFASLSNRADSVSLSISPGESKTSVSPSGVPEVSTSEDDASITGNKRLHPFLTSSSATSTNSCIPSLSSSSSSSSSPSSPSSSFSSTSPLPVSPISDKENEMPRDESFQQLQFPAAAPLRISANCVVEDHCVSEVSPTIVDNSDIHDNAFKRQRCFGNSN